MKKTNKHMTMGMSLGMCLGMAIGTSFGNLYENMSVGLSFGLGLGMLVGMLLGHEKDKQIEKQMEDKGYTVHSVVPTDDGHFLVTVRDKQGMESIHNIHKDTMESEKFTVGDTVYLDAEGHLENIKEEEN